MAELDDRALASGVDFLDRVAAIATGVQPSAGSFPKPHPLPTGMPTVPAFDELLLPGVLRPWVMDIAERLQCAPDFPAVSAMVSLGSVVGRGLTIRPKRHDDWTVVPNLWGSIVGRPSVMKSPAIEAATAPLRRLVADAHTAHQAQIADHKARIACAKLQSEQDQKAARSKIKDGDTDGAYRTMRHACAMTDEPAPVERRFVVNDSTVEKLGELLAGNDRGLLMLRDELVGWLSALDREGREGDRSFFLEAFNGSGSFVVDRIGRGTVRIDACCVSVLGGVQPGPLGQYVRQAARGGSGDDGLIQRFQMAVWPDYQHWRHVDRQPDYDAKNDAFALFERFASADSSMLGATTSEGLPFVRFDAAGQSVFDEWYTELNRRVRSGVLHPALEAHLCKYSSLMPSLALLSHLAEGSVGSVSEAAALSAAAWCEYLEGHALRIYAPASHSDEIGARELARRLLRGDLPETFRVRELYRRGWAGLGTPEEALAAVELLVELRGVFTEQQIPDGNGGRPTTNYRVNPRIHEVWG